MNYTVSARFITVRQYEHCNTVSFARVVNGKYSECKITIPMRHLSNQQLQRISDLSYKATKVTSMFFRHGTMTTMGFFPRNEF